MPDVRFTSRPCVNLPVVVVMCVHSSAVPPLIPFGSVCMSPAQTTAPKLFCSVFPKSDFAITGPGIGTPDDDEDDADDDADDADDDEAAEPDDEAANPDDDEAAPDDEAAEPDADDADEEDEPPDPEDDEPHESPVEESGFVVVSSKQPATIVVIATKGITRLTLRGIMRPLFQGGGVVGS